MPREQSSRRIPMMSTTHCSWNWLASYSAWKDLFLPLQFHTQQWDTISVNYTTYTTHMYTTYRFVIYQSI